MKTKLSSLLFVFAFITPLVFLQAQAIQITGVVSDQNGVPIPGVNITLAGTTTGTSTDFDGKYELDVEQGQVLHFSSVGFQDQNITVESSSTINVTMVEGTALDEVVVTALGISRSKRSLGYSTQQVDSEALSNTPTSNFTNALSGKVAGLSIKRNNNFGGSTNTVIRGISSITGNNQALYVVDGVPISNENTNTAEQQVGRGTTYDYGNAAADINPEDIESVNVLKGASAAALYGSRAANGVIEITTKRGKRDDRLGVTLNSGIEFGVIDKSTWPIYQTKYGSGYSGDFGKDANGNYLTFVGDDGELKRSNFRDDGSWGPAFTGEPIYQWDAFDPDSPNYLKATPWEAAGRRGPIKFFETPVTLTNSIAVANGSDKGAYRISYLNKLEDGFMPNMDASKNDVRFNGNYDISDDFRIKTSANYIKTNHKGRNSTGYSDNIVTLFRQWWATDVDIVKQRDIFKSTGRNVSWNPKDTSPGAPTMYWDNPYWTRYKNYQNDSRSRFLGNITADYDVTDWFTVTGRAGTDTYSEHQEERRAVGSNPESFGVTRGNTESGYLRKDITFYENNFDLMLNFDTQITEDLDFTGLLGGSIRRNEFNSILQSTSGGLIVPDLYSLANSVNDSPKPVERMEKTGTNSFYGQVTFGYDKMLYLDATLRRDAFSTLPKGSNSIWYPSISGSFIFTELFKGTQSAVDFGKFSLNYAEVGNGAPFDRLYDSYVFNDDIGTSSSSTKNNEHLKPERTKSFEAGLEMQFFKNRLGFNLNYYITNTIDQIIQAPVSTTSGFSNRLLNAGEIENKGVELSLNATPIETQDWRWNINVNWSKNKSLVSKLPDGVETIQLLGGGFQGGVSYEASEGQPFGIIRGRDFVYDDKGNRLIMDVDDPEDTNYGKYQQSDNANQIIGDTNPDWLMGINNSVKWKNLSMSFLIDISKGGDVFSLDQWYGEGTGLYPETAFLNDNGVDIRVPLDEGGGFINPGVLPDGSPNDRRVDANKSNSSAGLGYTKLPQKAFIYDATYVKLRELSISYNLPMEVLENTFLSGVQFSLTGNNLWIIHKKLPYADPESGLGSGSVQGYITGAMPTYRQIGFNVRLQF